MSDFREFWYEGIVIYLTDEGREADSEGREGRKVYNLKGEGKSESFSTHYELGDFIVDNLFGEGCCSVVKLNRGRKSDEFSLPYLSAARSVVSVSGSCGHSDELIELARYVSHRINERAKAESAQ